MPTAQATTIAFFHVKGGIVPRALKPNEIGDLKVTTNRVAILQVPRKVGEELVSQGCPDQSYFHGSPWRAFDGTMCFRVKLDSLNR